MYAPRVTSHSALKLEILNGTSALTRKNLCCAQSLIMHDSATRRKSEVMSHNSCDAVYEYTRLLMGLSDDCHNHAPVYKND